VRYAVLEPTARRILRVEMSKKGKTYADLTRSLCFLGLDENERNVRNKIARGTFSADFFVQCLYALDIRELDLRHFGPMRERPLEAGADDDED
jgi:hypothetical protein